MNILKFAVDKEKQRIHYVNIAFIDSFYYNGEVTHISAGDRTYCLEGDRTVELRKALCQVDNGMLIQLD